MKIALLGDIAFYGKYSTQNKNVFNYFEDLSNVLKKHDFVIGNLETPFINDGVPYGAKSAHIKANEENIELLKYFNIKYVNLANNHIFDFGISGYEKTKRILQENLIQYFGIENKEAYIEVNNNKLALSGYCCYSTNALGYQDNTNMKGVNALDGYFLEQRLIKNDENGYLNLVSIHAGQEHVNYPNTDHIKLARILANKVPYIYYGHHPHVIQGIEKIENSLIAYSLGNLCFDDVYTNKSNKPLIEQSEENKKSFILSIEINNNKIESYEVIPFYLGEDKAILSSKEITNEIEVYSKALTYDLNNIDMIRQSILSQYIMKRKKARDLSWYIKRINFNSLRMIFNARKNLIEYNRVITQYIKDRCSNDEYES